LSSNLKLIVINIICGTAGAQEAYERASARVRHNVLIEERERAMNEAKAFAPTNPYCLVPLRPSYLYRGCIMVRY